MTEYEATDASACWCSDGAGRLRFEGHAAQYRRRHELRIMLSDADLALLSALAVEQEHATGIKWTDEERCQRWISETLRAIRDRRFAAPEVTRCRTCGRIGADEPLDTDTALVVLQRAIERERTG